MDEPNDARNIARKWWADHLEGHDVVDVKKSARLAEDMLRRDPAFMAGFTDAFLRSALYEMGLRILANHRAELRTREGMLRQLEKDAATIEWARWREWDPTSGTHIALTEMNKEQLSAASAFRYERAESYRKDALWFETMATYLNPGVKLGEVLSNEEITALRRIAQET